MAELIVHDVPEELIAKLRDLANRNGISVEEQHRRMLSEMLNDPPAEAKPKRTFLEALCAMPNVGEDWMFDRHDPRMARPDRREQVDFGNEA